MNTVIWLCGVAIAAASGPDDSALDLADLPAYRTALQPRSGAEMPAAAVGFRDLWDDPERYRGRRVRVQGRIVRRFHQEPFGTFPALTETWIVAASGDPSCLVFPTVLPADEPAPGTSVQFTGTFLKRLRYPAADTARLAPLIVGDRPPEARGDPPAEAREVGFSRLDWGIGIAATVIVTLILAREFLGRPRRRRLRPGPPPEFWSPGSADPCRSAKADDPGAEHDSPSDR